MEKWKNREREKYSDEEWHLEITRRVSCIINGKKGLFCSNGQPSTLSLVRLPTRTHTHTHTVACVTKSKVAVFQLTRVTGCEWKKETKEPTSDQSG